MPFCVSWRANWYRLGRTSLGSRFAIPKLFPWLIWTFSQKVSTTLNRTLWPRLSIGANRRRPGNGRGKQHSHESKWPGCIMKVGDNLKSNFCISSYSSDHEWRVNIWTRSTFSFYFHYHPGFLCLWSHCKWPFACQWLQWNWNLPGLFHFHLCLYFTF